MFRVLCLSAMLHKNFPRPMPINYAAQKCSTSCICQLCCTRMFHVLYMPVVLHKNVPRPVSLNNAFQTMTISVLLHWHSSLCSNSQVTNEVINVTVSDQKIPQLWSFYQTCGFWNWTYSLLQKKGENVPIHLSPLQRDSLSRLIPKEVKMGKCILFTLNVTNVELSNNSY